MSGNDGNNVSSPRSGDPARHSSRLCMSIADRLVAAWYAPQLTLLTAALVPLSIVFRSAVALRRTLYRSGLLHSERLPVPVGRNRFAAARSLLAAHGECNVIIADDGLQHYAMARTVEIAVVDVGRGLGNGFMLPAGPLREPASRLDEVDAVVRLMSKPGSPPTRISARQSTMVFSGDSFVRINAPAIVASAASFRSAGVHALAGIGNPQRFFDHLRSLGIDATCHAFPDHYRFTPADLALAEAAAILMTEKDAVKCVAFVDDRCWTLPVRAVVDASLVTLIEGKLRGFQAAKQL